MSNFGYFTSTEKKNRSITTVKTRSYNGDI